MSGITFIRRDQNDGVNIVRIVAADTLATIGTTGYLLAQNANIVALNHGTFDWLATDMVLVSASNGWGFFNPSSDFESLVPFVIVPGVTTPTIVGHIAVYDSTGGNIGEDAATAINGGNIQAGLSGTAGTLASFPATASKGSLKLVAVANTGNTNTTISNAAMGQASVISIPDPGLATSSFLLTDSAGTQTIATGNLSLTLGNLVVAAGTIAASQGNVSAGSSGHAGTVSSFPGTAANGSLILSALNAGGAFNTTIRNSVMGQSTVYSLGDIGAATGGIPVSTAAILMKSVAGAAAAGGNAAQSFTDAFCTSGSNVIGNWNTQANAASVLKIVPGNGSFVVTSSADAGVGTFNYVIMK